MKKLNLIAQELINMTEEELKQAEEDIHYQLNYTHVLKLAEAKRIRKIGEHNLKILDAFKELRRVIVEENPFKEMAE